MKVDVYTKTMCPYCVSAKRYLQQHNIPYTEHLLDDDAQRMTFYEKIGNGVRTVPQIFFSSNGQVRRIGGYSDLTKSDLVDCFRMGNFDESF